MRSAKLKPSRRMNSNNSLEGSASPEDRNRKKNELSRSRPMIPSRRNLKTKPSMTIHSTGGGHDQDVVRNSSLYREFQAERDEILRHKWLESEKAGHDIGFERALTDWIVNHRAQWRRTRQMLSGQLATSA